MINLWQQICEIADFDKNNEVDTEEFMKGVETACKGKSYEDLPEAFKFFIEAQFRTIDVDGKKENALYMFLRYFELIFLSRRRFYRYRGVSLRLCWPYGLPQYQRSG